MQTLITIPPELRFMIVNHLNLHDQNTLAHTLPFLGNEILPEFKKIHWYACLAVKKKNPKTPLAAVVYPEGYESSAIAFLEKPRKVIPSCFHIFQQLRKENAIEYLTIPLGTKYNFLSSKSEQCYLHLSRKFGIPRLVKITLFRKKLDSPAITWPQHAFIFYP